MFLTSVLPYEHSKGSGESSSSRTAMEPGMRHSCRTWGTAERCRRLLEAGLPSSTSSQSRPGLCLQSGQPPWDSLPWGLWWPLLPCGPWSCTTDSGWGQICALTPARSLSDIVNRMVAKSVLSPVSTPVFLLVSPVVYFDSLLSQAIEWTS